MDKMWNGAFLGLLFGLLLVSSSITVIQSVVSTITGIIPTTYRFQYDSYILFGAIGALIGYIIDKK